MLGKQAGWTPTPPAAAANTSPSVHTCCQDPHDQLMEEKNALNLTHEWVRPVHGTRQKYMMIILQPTKGGLEKVRDEPKSSKSTEFQAGHLAPSIRVEGGPRLEYTWAVAAGMTRWAWSLMRNRLEDWAPVGLR